MLPGSILCRIINNDYKRITLVDIKNKSCSIYTSDDLFTVAHFKKNYQEYVQEINDTFVYEDDKKIFLERMSFDAIFTKAHKNELQPQKNAYVAYRNIDCNNKISYIAVKCFFADENEETIIMLTYDDTEHTTERLKERKILELSNKAIQFVVQNLCEDFLQLNIDTGEFLMATQNNDNMVCKNTYAEQIQWFADNIVAPEEREFYLKELELDNLIQSIRAHNGFYSINCTVVYKDGRHDFLIASALIYDPALSASEYLFAYAQDITIQKRQEENNKRLINISQKLYDMSQLDRLTGLLNRSAAEKAINKRLRQRSEGESGGLLLIDVDNFKAFNDQFGHLIGDEVLKSLGVNMKDVFRADDILSRWGGDEFLIFMDHISEKTIESRLDALRRRMKYFKTGQRLLPVSLSIGGVIAPHGVAELMLFQKADEALYKVKQQSKDGVHILSIP